MLCISMQGQSHVAQPTVNLGDISFLDGVAGPGFVFEEIGDIAHAGGSPTRRGTLFPLLVS